MSRLRHTKTTFTAGEVSRALLGRGDLRAYENGALTLRNLFIFPTGGVRRRAGLRYVDTAQGAGRLIAFAFNTEQTYLLVFTAGHIAIYANESLVTVLPAPWKISQIPQIVWTQSADTLLIVHPDTPPKRLIRRTGGWFLEDWDFILQDTGLAQPHSPPPSPSRHRDYRVTSPFWPPERYFPRCTRASVCGCAELRL